MEKKKSNKRAKKKQRKEFTKKASLYRQSGI
jgi:hypothetical protein